MKDMFQKNWVSQLSILVACCLFLPISASAGIIDGDLTNDAAGTNHLSQTIPEAILAQGPGSISGTVTPPVAGVKVYAIKKDTNDFRGKETDSSGKYSIENLPLGDYKIFFFPPAGSGIASEWYIDQPTGGDIDALTLITLSEANKTVSGIDAGLEGAGSISGKVTYGDGSGVAWARVDAYAIDNPDPTTGGWLGGTVTEPDGTYTLEGLRTDISFKVLFKRSGLTKWYNDKQSRGSADTVNAGDSDIDAVLDFNWLLFLPTIIINTTKL